MGGTDEVIGDSISVVLAKAGFQTLVETMRVDTTRVISRTFVMAVY